MTLRLNGDSSGFTEIKAASAAGDNSITLPTSNGGANQLLKNGGTAGELEYASGNNGVSCDNEGRLLIGTSSDVTGTSDQRDGLQIVSSNGARAVFGRDDDTIVNGNLIGGLHFFGNVGGTYDQIGQVVMNATAEHTSVSKPTLLKFSTTSVGSTASSTRLTIQSDGALKLGSNSPGIDFSGIQTNTSGMTSEILDSYEEGTWTPSDNTSANLTFVLADGRYVKIGSFVHCWGRVAFPATTDTSLTAIGGLPFTNLHTIPYNYSGNTTISNFGDPDILPMLENQQIIFRNYSNGTYRNDELSDKFIYFEVRLRT